MTTENYRSKFALRAESTAKDLDEKCGFYSIFKKVFDDLMAQQATLDSMFKEHDEKGMGLIYENDRQQYGFVLPDASAHGKFRYQLFDAQGFFTHSTHSTLDEAIYELCAAGFDTYADQTTLQTLSATTLWRFKTEALALRTAVEDGLYTWEQGNVLYLELRKKHYPAEAA